MKFNEAKYLEKHGLYCPYCESEDLDAGYCEFDDNYAWRDVICGNCNRKWTETFTLSGAIELVNYSNSQ